jgi:hypothetical protein
MIRPARWRRWRYESELSFDVYFTDLDDRPLAPGELTGDFRPPPPTGGGLAWRLQKPAPQGDDLDDHIRNWKGCIVSGAILICNQEVAFMTTATTDRIKKEILLRAPRERVWRALTDS